MKLKKSLFAMMTAFVTLGISHAQEQGWNWNVVPYLWVSGLEGTVEAAGLTSEVSKSPSEILEDLSLAGMISLDGNNGSWGCVSDVFYVKLKDSQNTPVGKVTAELEQWIVSVVPYKRIVSDGKRTVDVGAGGRYIDTDVDIKTPMKRGSENRDWIDPVVMMRSQLPISEKWMLGFSGDIGGFGVESDFTWQLTGYAGYAVSPAINLLIGYRHLDIDYSDGAFSYDVATSGFALGAHFAL